jgi:hypothetical protein
VHHFTRRLARLEAARSKVAVDHIWDRIERCLAAGTPAVSDALAAVQQRCAEATCAAGRLLDAAELLRLPKVDAAMERLVDCVVGGTACHAENRASSLLGASKTEGCRHHFV